MYLFIYYSSMIFYCAVICWMNKINSINDMPECIQAKPKLFADESIIYWDVSTVSRALQIPPNRSGCPATMVDRMGNVIQPFEVQNSHYPKEKSHHAHILGVPQCPGRYVWNTPAQSPMATKFGLLKFATNTPVGTTGGRPPATS